MDITVVLDITREAIGAVADITREAMGAVVVVEDITRKAIGSVADITREDMVAVADITREDMVVATTREDTIGAEYSRSLDVQLREGRSGFQYFLPSSPSNVQVYVFEN